MICECGRALGASIEMTMECACGRSHIVKPEVSPYTSRLSQRVRTMFPSLFMESGDCRCSDAVALMDRWGVIKSIENAAQLAELLRSDVLTVIDAIRQASPQEQAHIEQAGVVVDVSPFVATPLERDDVRLVSVHFNPAKFRRRCDTYYEWIESLGPLAKYHRCYELVLDDDHSEIEGSKVIRGTRQLHAMWQKEALINIALRACPERIKYFGWLDHDLILTRPDWLRVAIDEINAGSVACQLFNAVTYLSEDRKAQRTLEGCPGGAWLADRKYLDRIGGLPCRAIVGGGDRDFVKLAGRDAPKVPAAAYHLYHGAAENRQNASRFETLRIHGYDPERDVRLNDVGVIEWATHKPRLHDAVANYFADRREDD